MLDRNTWYHIVCKQMIIFKYEYLLETNSGIKLPHNGWHGVKPNNIYQLSYKM